MILSPFCGSYKLDVIEIRDKEVVTDVLEAVNAGRNTHQTLNKAHKLTGNVRREAGKVLKRSFLRRKRKSEK